MPDLVRHITFDPPESVTFKHVAGKEIQSVTISNTHDQEVVFMLKHSEPGVFSVKPVFFSLLPGTQITVELTKRCTEGFKPSVKDRFAAIMAIVPEDAPADWDSEQCWMKMQEELAGSLKIKELRILFDGVLSTADNLKRKILLHPSKFVQFKSIAERQDQEVTITNSHTQIVMFKMKYTSPAIFKVKPVFFSLEPRTHKTVKLSYFGTLSCFGPEGPKPTHKDRFSVIMAIMPKTAPRGWNVQKIWKDWSMQVELAGSISRKALRIKFDERDVSVLESAEPC